MKEITAIRLFITSLFLLCPIPAIAWLDDDRYQRSYSHNYSGEGRWYVSGGLESGTVDQQLTDADRSFSYTGPRVTVGGVGPRAIRFEFGWSRVVAEEQDWGVTGLDGDLWLPWEPERRIRPYLILGMGYHTYYGADSDFLVTNDTDNGARSINLGFAMIGNVSKLTEIGVSFRYRFISWTAHADVGENVPEADATLSSIEVRLQQLF